MTWKHRILMIAEMPYGQAGWSFKHAFEEIWAQVMTIESFIFYLPQTKFNWLLSKLAAGINVVLNRVRLNLFFPRKKVISFDPKLILVLKGTHLHPNTVKKLKNKFWSNAKLVNWNFDSPFADYNTTSWYLSSIPLYDVHVTFAHYLQPLLTQAGAQKTIWMPFWYDEKLMPTGNITISDEEKGIYACDLLFIGTRDKEREIILSWIVNKHNVKIIWNNRDRCSDVNVKKSVIMHAIYGDEFVKAARCAKVNLNILRAQNVGSHNMRNIEIPACGGVLLTQWSNEIEELSKWTPNIYYRRSKEELLTQLATLVSTSNVNVELTQQFREKYAIQAILQSFLTKLQETNA